MTGRGRARAVIAASVTAALLVVVVRLWVAAAAALAEGEAAESGHRPHDAVVRYQEAARLYLPFGGPSHAAVARLVALAEAAEAAHDDETARQAWAGVRTAALGCRSLFTPHAVALARADERLAQLYAAAEATASDDPPVREARRRWHAERLSHRPGPRPAPSLAALLGAGLWIAAASLFTQRAFDAALKFNPRAALLCGAAFVVGMSLFLVGLRLA